MPLLKYTLFAGASLLALMFVAARVVTPPPASASRQTIALDVLREMANHGAVRGFAPLAAAGPFLPMAATVPSITRVAEPAIDRPATVAAVSPSVLNAQARVAATDLIDKPTVPDKKPVARKVKPRIVYVENRPRGRNDIFGGFNTW